MVLSKITNEFLKLSKTTNFNLNTYLSTLTNKNLEKILRELSKTYYNDGISLVTDNIFDYLKNILEEKDPLNDFLNEIGAPIVDKNKTQLPFSMNSLDKIKPSTNEIYKWKTIYKGPYVISDKLDGISAQLFLDINSEPKLYTRGDGQYGQDISYLIKYLFDISKFPINTKLSIRGELILTKKNFLKIKDKFKNARNAVAGFVNSKKIDKTLSNLVEFIGYTVIYPELTIEQQMEFLENFNALHKVVKYKLIQYDKLTNEYLSKYLEKRRSNAEFEIDGIVVFDSSKIYKHLLGNPIHGFAFKNILSDQYSEALVIDVLWEPSMDGYLKPRVQIEPIELVGVTITYATAFHAKFVEDNNLGPGSVIKLIRSGDVIPHILEVLNPSTSGKPKMPDDDYIWDDNHVNILLKNINKNKYVNIIKAKQLDYFFSNIGVKNLSIGILTKFVDNGYDNVIKILSADKNELYNIDGLGTKSINKIFNNIDDVMTTITLDKLMTGSHVFGHGISEKKIKLIIKNIPNLLVLSDNILKDSILKINGFSNITTNKFVDNLHKFKLLFNELNNIYNLKHLTTINKKNITNVTKNTKLNNIKIVFTGFRDSNLETTIENMGGSVSTSISSKTNILVHSDSDNDVTSSKLDKAKSLNITIMSKSDFINKYINI